MLFAYFLSQHLVCCSLASFLRTESISQPYHWPHFCVPRLTQGEGISAAHVAVG